MTGVLLFRFAVLSLSVHGIYSGFKHPTCKDDEILVSFCDALQRDSLCYFCQPDSNLGLECSVDSECRDAHSICDGIRCGCSDCNVCACYLPYVDSNGRYYGGACSTGSNLGSRCINDAGCYDGRQCNGTTCGCIKSGQGQPKCGCNNDLGYRDSNGDGIIGGTCISSNLHAAACIDTNDCYDEAGQCDGVRCGCHCNLCRGIEA